MNLPIPQIRSGETVKKPGPYSPFIFRLWRFAIARNSRIDSVTGYRKLLNFIFLKSSLPPAYYAGYDDAMQHALESINCLQAADLRASKFNQWDSGFNTATNLLRRSLTSNRDLYRSHSNNHEK